MYIDSILLLLMAGACLFAARDLLHTASDRITELDQIRAAAEVKLFWAKTWHDAQVIKAAEVNLNDDLYHPVETWYVAQGGQA